MKTTNKIILSLFLWLLLTSCAAPPPAPKEEISSARALYMICLVPYATRFDDRVSDAQTIARAMVGACPAEYNAFFDTITRNDNARVKRLLRERQSKIQSDIALEVVLDMRARSK